MNYKIDDNEYKNRVLEVQKKMKEEGLDGLIVHSNESDFAGVRYFTHYWPLFETGGVFIPQKGEPVLIIGPESETFAKGRSKVKKIAKLLPYRESAEPNYPGIPLDSFESIARDFGGTEAFKKIGISGMSIMPVPVYEAIRASFPRAQIAPTGIVSNLRKIKSKDEIACLRAGFQIAEKTLDQVLAVIRPGMSEAELVGVVQKGLYEFGAEYESHPVYVLSGPNSNNAIGRPTHRILQKGDVVQLNFGGKVDGYSPSIGRPIVLGKADPEQKKLLEVGLEAHHKTFEWMKSGVEARTVVEKFIAFIKEKGCEKYYLYGPAHGLGLMEVEEPWVESTSTYKLE
ncbi:MAG: aminopeptidase P family protein, partial [Spirochaetia bacterium]|nr:aminopeptidase P family protein [Spirochaetia bacterium]